MDKIPDSDRKKKTNHSGYDENNLGFSSHVVDAPNVQSSGTRDQPA
jgi:hypothetical protein